MHFLYSFCHDDAVEGGAESSGLPPRTATSDAQPTCGVGRSRSLRSTSTKHQVRYAIIPDMKLSREGVILLNCFVNCFVCCCGHDDGVGEGDAESSGLPPVMPSPPLGLRSTVHAS